MISIFRLFTFLLLFIFSCSGVPLKISSSPPPPSFIPTASKSSCHNVQGNHSVFHISVDGTDVGREVRTVLFKKVDDRLERIFISHLVRNERMGTILFPSILVRTEVTDGTSSKLILADVVQRNQMNTSGITIFLSGDKWKRTINTSGTFSPSSSDAIDELPLNGNEIMGFGLVDLLREISLGKVGDISSISFFDPLHNAPFDISLSLSSADTLSFDGQDISGRWVEVRKNDNNNLLVRALFDSEGLLWFEDYPEIHETRRRATGPFSLPSDTSELIVGLRSSTYLFDPNIASRATYHLVSTPDRLDALSLLEEPLNQSVVRVSPQKLVLTVHAGAPDQQEPPDKRDLGSSYYIQPDHPKIVQAYQYIRHAGKRGHLSRERRLNAVPVIAQVSLIPNAKKFWSDPDKVAGLFMRYVSALLPDKRHTFSMSDAVTTLEKGSGDCTEHTVLFTSLMRAHGIPTRLVTGLFLTHGGLWAYHMWASYWDGSSWQSIDPSTMTSRTGALHVALGRGAPVFADIRDRLADFMWRTFSGVSFDLVEASNKGESLFLARPIQNYRNLGETALFNAVVLSDRGDHLGALKLLDDNISSSARSLSVKCMRAELLVNAGRCDEALLFIDTLRKETSSEENISLLDRLELKCLLQKKSFDRIDDLYSRVDASLYDNPSERAALKSRLLFAKGQENMAISFLEDSLKSHPEDTALLLCFSELVSSMSHFTESLLKRALILSWMSVQHTSFSNSDALYFFVKILLLSDYSVHAEWFIDHALILSPNDARLHELRKRLPSPSSCSSD